jgi:hypothetical protein
VLKHDLAVRVLCIDVVWHVFCLNFGDSIPGIPVTEINVTLLADRLRAAMSGLEHAVPKVDGQLRVLKSH